MSMLRLTFLSVLLSITACSVAGKYGDGPVATSADLQRLSESSWSGTLGYLDYSSERWAEVPVAMRFDAVNGRKARFHVRYPSETQYNESDTLKLSKSGRALSGDVIIERREAQGTLTLVTESRGKDDGRPADFRMTYTISDATLVISKSVRFDGEQAFFRRNAYELQRQ